MSVNTAASGGKPAVCDGEMEELDEYACRAFNPDDHICVVLPSGAYATVAPDCPPEALAALDRLAVLAAAQFTNGGHG